LKKLNDMEKEKTRYTDEELLEFKEIILNKLEVAKAEFRTLQSNLRKFKPISSPPIKIHEEFRSCLGENRK